MLRFQILSLIGGGIRGEFIISLLNDLEQKLGRPIAESFDLIPADRRRKVAHGFGHLIAVGTGLGKLAL